MNPTILQEARNAVTKLLADFPELSEDDQLRLDMIEGETGFVNLIRRLVIEAQAASAHVAGIKMTVGEMIERRERLEMRRDRLRGVILSLMEHAALPSIPLPEATVSVQRRGPQPIAPANIDDLPPEFIRTKIERSADMGAIQSAIKDGRTIPGVQMSNGSTSLAIRR
jgi:hypothetical protein